MFWFWKALKLIKLGYFLFTAHKRSRFVRCTSALWLTVHFVSLVILLAGIQGFACPPFGIISRENTDEQARWKKYIKWKERKKTTHLERPCLREDDAVVMNRTGASVEGQSKRKAHVGRRNTQPWRRYLFISRNLKPERNDDLSECVVLWTETLPQSFEKLAPYEHWVTFCTVGKVRNGPIVSSLAFQERSCLLFSFHLSK